MRRLLAVLLLLAGCHHAEAPAPAYVLGAPYQAGGVWRYPREDFTLVQTGLATVYDGQGRTANGEAFDATALAAAHPTLQLPALARLTNLENGRQVLVRINDRGPAAPGRMLAITRRTAELLAAADPSAIRVRLEVVESESRQMASDLRAEGPDLKIATAGTVSVQAESLVPPPGAAQAPQRAAAVAPAARPAFALAPANPVPLRLPEKVLQGPASPGRLMIECGTFSTVAGAQLMQARLAPFGAHAETDYNAPRDSAYMVRIGPLPDVGAADAMLARVLREGAADARIVVVP